MDNSKKYLTVVLQLVAVGLFIAIGMVWFLAFYKFDQEFGLFAMRTTAMKGTAETFIPVEDFPEAAFNWKMNYWKIPVIKTLALLLMSVVAIKLSKRIKKNTLANIV